MPFEPQPAESVFKSPGDSLVYTMNAGFQPEILNGDTIVSASISAAAISPGTGSLTIGTDTIASPLVNVPISGGTADSDYVVTFTMTLSTGKVRVLYGIMKVRAQ